MKRLDFREESRKAYGRDVDDSEPGLPLDALNCGSLMRIADATEKMATNYTQLQNDRDYWKRRANDAEVRLKTEQRRAAALRGVLKRRAK